MYPSFFLPLFMWSLFFSSGFLATSRAKEKKTNDTYGASQTTKEWKPLGIPLFEKEKNSESRSPRKEHQISSKPSSMKSTSRRSSAIVSLVPTKDWSLQLALIRHYTKQGKKALPLLSQFLRSKNIRVRLLASIALASLKDTRAIPMLIKEAKRLFDQPAPLLLGAFLAYGEKAVQPLIKAIQSTKRRRKQLWMALAYLKSKQAIPLFSPMLTHSQKNRRQLARMAIENLDPSESETIYLNALARYPSANFRAEILRALEPYPTFATLKVLYRHREDPDESVRFLVRILLVDRIQKLQKEHPHQIESPPKSKADQAKWTEWWTSHKEMVQKIYNEKRSLTILFPPKKYDPKTTLLYRTVHPMFGVGRMPILIHEKGWAPSLKRYRGKVWRYPMERHAFYALLKRIYALGFFDLREKTGHYRDITLRIGARTRTVRAGKVRYFAFERIEQLFLSIAKKIKLGLHFSDLYKRPDERDLTKEGKIGQWAFRKRDRLAPAKWPNTPFKPIADLESTFAALKDIVERMPARTRLSAFDISEKTILMRSLLFGSRVQSKRTIDALSRSRRLPKLKYAGQHVLYLTQDKLEEIFLTSQRFQIPKGIQFRACKKGRASILSVLSQGMPPSIGQFLSFSIESKDGYRIDMKSKFRDVHAVLKWLSHLAIRSQGDRVYALRINPSGEEDRDRYGLIVQMRWQMMSPCRPPATVPDFLSLGDAPAHDLFTPLLR